MVTRLRSCEEKLRSYVVFCCIVFDEQSRAIGPCGRLNPFRGPRGERGPTPLRGLTPHAQIALASWPSFNPPKSWFRQQATGDGRRETADGGKAPDVPYALRLTPKLRPHPGHPLIPPNPGSDNAAMRPMANENNNCPGRFPECNSGQQPRIENPSYIMCIL